MSTNKPTPHRDPIQATDADAALEGAYRLGRLHGLAAARREPASTLPQAPLAATDDRQQVPPPALAGHPAPTPDATQIPERPQQLPATGVGCAQDGEQQGDESSRLAGCNCSDTGDEA